jgi:hypothetical protein
MDSEVNVAAETEKYTSFEEFWPFYLREHSHPLNRALHFVGTTGVIACAAGAVLTANPMLLLAAPVCGYGFAWVGHFIVEKNRPATFTYPLWSLRADFKMYGKTLTGKLRAELDKAGVK